MTYIPRKDENDNQHEEYSNKKEISWEEKFGGIDLGKVMEESNFFGGLAVMFFYLTIFLSIITTGHYKYLFHKVPAHVDFGLANPYVTVTCQIITAVIFIVAVMESGWTPKHLLADIIRFVGAFSKERSPEEIQEMLKNIEESNERDIKRYNDRVEQSKKDYGYYESLKKPEDPRDFNTRQKEERRARAYEKADPEFEISYRSTGGCWVRDIVRGRDKAELMARYKKNPMVLYVGAVVGLEE